MLYAKQRSCCSSVCYSSGLYPRVVHVGFMETVSQVRTCFSTVRFITYSILNFNVYHLRHIGLVHIRGGQYFYDLFPESGMETFYVKEHNFYCFCLYISLYITFTPTCFDISVSSSGSFTDLCLSKLYKFLKLRLLNLKFRKIFRLKYIKMLFGRR